MKNSEFQAIVMKELNERLSLKDDAVFGALYTDDQTRVQMKKFIIEIPPVFDMYFYIL